jgi:hypothetical protein
MEILHCGICIWCVYIYIGVCIHIQLPRILKPLVPYEFNLGALMLEQVWKKKEIELILFINSTPDFF